MTGGCAKGDRRVVQRGDATQSQWFHGQDWRLPTVMNVQGFDSLHLRDCGCLPVHLYCTT